VICEVAEQVSADLIVMGTHGRKRLAQLLLGSVAARTLQQASCPVLTVRAPSDAA
jgi:nucleotide-binding universal stress UspA family protein